MVFGKHINKYYLRYALPLLIGLATLVAVDYLQLIIPNMYQMVVNGMNTGYVTVNGAKVPFDMTFVLDRICLPMIIIIVCITAGRFLWRIMFFGSGIRVSTHIRNKMFD
ncbi:MAG: hypothetical protein II736_03390, partial [Clostridia bacterium]|nr:hypothetical protein [Clostridia bacterium]